MPIVKHFVTMFGLSFHMCWQCCKPQQYWKMIDCVCLYNSLFIWVLCLLKANNISNESIFNFINSYSNFSLYSWIASSVYIVLEAQKITLSKTFTERFIGNIRTCMFPKCFEEVLWNKPCSMPLKYLHLFFGLFYISKKQTQFL